jgi:Leucine-rich repeat (LRR) protein
MDDANIFKYYMEQNINSIELRLSNKKLVIIPPEIGKFSQLQKLYLYNNQKLVIPPEIGKLSKLTKLALQNNQITIIPLEICKLFQLRELGLSHNRISVIPLEIGNLLQLQHLNLCDNQISIIPPEISQLLQLQELYLYNNQISVIPPEIGQLLRLQYLNLGRNKISTIPSEIGNLLQLQELGLSYNRISVIPSEIGHLSQLRILNLYNNQISVIPPEIGQLLRLKNLFLYNNKIMQLPLFLIYMNGLNLVYYGNEIINFHPAITRWLNKYKTTHNVYGNKQSVHDHNVQQTTNDSIKNFVKIYQPNITSELELINLLNLPTNVQNVLKLYISSNHVHSYLQLTFSEILIPVLDYIYNHVNKAELVKILSEEIVASHGKCFQGIIARLINVLNGYHGAVNIKISDNEQISNIIVLLKNTNNVMIDEFIKLFKVEMVTRSYDTNTIDEWVEYIRDNY